MSLDDGDWYREAVRERDAKQKSKVMNLKKRDQNNIHELEIKN